MIGSESPLMTTTEMRQLEQAVEDAVAGHDPERAEERALVYLRDAEERPGPGEVAHSPWFRSRYVGGRVSLVRGQLRQAVERLTPLLSFTSRVPADLAGRVRLLLAEALARLRQRGQARSLLEQVDAGLLARERLLWLRSLRIRLWLGEVETLADQLDDCGRALEVGGDTVNRVLLLCEEGIAWDVAGDVTRGRRCLEQARALSRSLGPGPIRADALLQLGRLDHLCGRLPAALDRYDEALVGASPGGQILEIKLRRLLVSLDMNQWRAAAAEADSLLRGIDLDGLPEEVLPLVNTVRGLLGTAGDCACSDEQQAYQAAARGDVASARSLYRRAVEEEPSPQRRARLALALGLLALGQSDREDALSWLRQAEDLARSLDLPEILGRTLQALGRVAAELDADDDSARLLFERAVSVFEVQAGQFSSIHDAMLYRHQQEGVLRQLLRAACWRGDADDVFRYQELDRGRLLLDLGQSSGATPGRAAGAADPKLRELQRHLDHCEQELEALPRTEEQAGRRRSLLGEWEELRLRRDRLLETFLLDRHRPATAALPHLPGLADLSELLPAGTLYVAPSLLSEELYLLVIRRAEPGRVVRARLPAAPLTELLTRLSKCIATQTDLYRRGLLRHTHRVELDEHLETLGKSALGEALFREVDELRPGPRRLLWVPDGLLHGLPVHALRRGGRYLIEDLEVVQAFSGALLAHQARRRGCRGWWRPALVVTESGHVLPDAGREGAGVARSFWRSRTLHGSLATRAAVRSELARARVAHFACHADFDPHHPLAAALHLPSGEVLHAAEWFDEPVRDLVLVTLSACRTAEVAPLAGSERFGTVTGLLGAGVRAVLAGLWSVADREALPLMWSFYNHRLTCDLATALARAQRDALAGPDSSPLFWAAFALFGDPSALPAPPLFWRPLRLWRQRRHRRRYGPPAPTRPEDGGGRFCGGTKER